NGIDDALIGSVANGVMIGDDRWITLDVVIVAGGEMFLI
ncbi:unnamed protein product, partial [Rotaria magnacalcarata]